MRYLMPGGQGGKECPTDVPLRVRTPSRAAPDSRTWNSEQVRGANLELRPLSVAAPTRPDPRHQEVWDKFSPISTDTEHNSTDLGRSRPGINQMQYRTKPDTVLTRRWAELGTKVETRRWPWRNEAFARTPLEQHKANLSPRRRALKVTLLVHGCLRQSAHALLSAKAARASLPPCREDDLLLFNEVRPLSLRATGWLSRAKNRCSQQHCCFDANNKESGMPPPRRMALRRKQSRAWRWLAGANHVPPSDVLLVAPGLRTCCKPAFRPIYRSWAGSF